MAARIEEASVNIDAAVSSLLSNPPNIFSLKEHQRTVFPASLSSASLVGFDVSGWSSTSIKMTAGITSGGRAGWLVTAGYCKVAGWIPAKWFIQSYARTFDKAQPSETTLQWSDPRWMSGARRNEIHLARVRLQHFSIIFTFGFSFKKSWWMINDRTINKHVVECLSFLFLPSSVVSDHNTCTISEI